MIQVYEIPNTFTRDYPLDKQIELGINDWRAEFGAHVAFGHTRAEALGNLGDSCVHCRRAVEAA